MKLHSIRITNFQSFGGEPTEFTLEEITYLIGPNGSGKTAVLQALCRLFAFDSSLRRVKRTDFHIPQNESSPQIKECYVLKLILFFLKQHMMTIIRQ